MNTAKLVSLGADFGNYLPINATIAVVGNRQFVRCYQLGDDLWEESTTANPLIEWTFTRASGQFHARIKTTLAEAVRMAEEWNADCPSRFISTISGNGEEYKIQMAHQLCINH